MQRAHYIEQVGGAHLGTGFGEYDGYALFEAPDNVSMAGAVLAIGGGALASVRDSAHDRGRDARGPGREQDGAAGRRARPADGLTISLDARAVAVDDRGEVHIAQATSP